MQTLDDQLDRVIDALYVLAELEHPLAAITRKFGEMLLSTAKEAPDMVIAACGALGAKKQLSKGYFIETTDCFRHSDGAEFAGLHLTLFNNESRAVGAIGFRIGLPFEITVIQGKTNGEPQKFHQATNQSFDVALLDHFIYCVGSNIHFPPGHEYRETPKAVLNLDNVIDQKLENRIFSRYMPRTSRGDGCFAANMLHIRPTHFARAWRSAHPKQAQAPKPIGMA